MLEIVVNQQECASRPFREYYEFPRKRFAYIQKIVQDCRLQQLDMINKDKPMTQ